LLSDSQQNAAAVGRGAQLSLGREWPAAGLMLGPTWPCAAPALVTRQHLRKGSVAFAPKGSMVLKKMVVGGLSALPGAPEGCF